MHWWRVTNLLITSGHINNAVEAYATVIIFDWTMKGALILLVCLAVVSAYTSGKIPMRFPACRTSRCHIGKYSGFDCTDGYCMAICSPKGCSSGRLYGKLIRPEEFEMKPKTRQPNFAGCYKEYCSRGKVEGYDCENGHCNYVCMGNDCYIDA